jgi:hypothetical protein
MMITVLTVRRYMSTLNEEDERLFTYDYFKDALASPAPERPWVSPQTVFKTCYSCQQVRVLVLENLKIFALCENCELGKDR